MDDVHLCSSWCHDVMVIFHSHIYIYIIFGQRCSSQSWMKGVWDSWPLEDRKSSLRMARSFIYIPRRPGYHLDSWQKHESIEIWNIFMVYIEIWNMKLCKSSWNSQFVSPRLVQLIPVKSGSTWFAKKKCERSTFDPLHIVIPGLVNIQKTIENGHWNRWFSH